MTKTKGWIGIDFDGTLVEDNGWEGADKCGKPIKPMVDRVKKWLLEGKDIQIVTARVSAPVEELAIAKGFVEGWCKKMFGVVLPVRHDKDIYMLELWDDRCKQVIKNTGKLVEEEYAELKAKYDKLVNSK